MRQYSTKETYNLRSLLRSTAACVPQGMVRVGMDQYVMARLT